MTRVKFSPSILRSYSSYQQEHWNERLLSNGLLQEILLGWQHCVSTKIPYRCPPWNFWWPRLSEARVNFQMGLRTSNFSSDSSGYCRHSTLPANTIFESSLCPQGLQYITFSVPQRQYSAQVEDPCGKFHANRQCQYRYYTSRCCLLRIIKPCLLQALCSAP